ncbi:hypothetical protein HRR83_007924 [Exophiala dermatitidis]|uniref:Uncharacterized protein n=2 Tax=Exophiala dermatitidis TaxID=5970 RepID=H6BUG5_EXODN|nr:uncharacterized protein HMPREF1120_03833 [Exophiala dermatitidis NIH/UT8656]KAJ4508830.1 hypothetical protein HRR74_007421 [Exophiala dermatitidis]EHY55708.1 hypothetical protein HMPREF1120_03833 [Exophiala dermatitidis NIH/UT8656]KAJ4510082.1 hypothetical protein HRR73_006879 [Exophiala dermatitidis]KAJ4539085.1 hypothetical protein HRR77_006500 [Exophiala dermatitidis]KAJ4540634.1 hypothetical protein HRR76_004022 [Exophiala dermatitidis]
MYGLPEPVAESERVAMYDSMQYFLNNDAERQDDLLRYLQDRDPAIWRKIRDNVPYGPQDLSDETVRAISQIVYRHDTAKDVQLDVPQEQMTQKMMDFNDTYIVKLTEAKSAELQGLISSVVPRIALNPKGAQMKPSSLPENVQLMIHRYLRKHLPEEVKQQIKKEEADHDGDVDMTDAASPTPSEIEVKEFLEYWEYLEERERLIKLGEHEKAKKLEESEEIKNLVQRLNGT